MRPPKVLKMLTILTAFCLLLGMAASASADFILAPGIYVDDNSQLFTPSAKGAAAFDGVKVNWAFTDPGIIWSVNATNLNAAPMDVTVSFGPFATPPGYYNPLTVSSSIAGSLTDGTGDLSNSTGSVSITPYYNPVISVNYTYYLDRSGNPVYVNAWGVGPAFSASVGAGTLPYAGATVNYPVDYIHNQTLVPLGPGSNDYFIEFVSFELGPDSSTGLSGNCSFVATPIPLPPTALLLGSGLLGLGLAGWRRKRQS